MLRLMPTSQNEARKDFLERSTRWLLLLTLIHTIPVIWITPVAGGTAPTAGLLVFLIASLWTFDTEGIALGLMVGLPALIYCAIAWLPLNFRPKRWRSCPASGRKRSPACRSTTWCLPGRRKRARP